MGISDAKAEVIASFWDIEVSGQSSSDGGIGLTTAELQDINTYVDAGWDFAGEAENGTENVWYITMDSYPRHFSFQGKGTRDDPYQIDTVWHLLSIGSNPDMLDKHFKLTQHINLDPNQLGSRVFTHAVIAPDVNYANNEYDGVSFSGTFDGSNNEIRNLTIMGTGYLGLFGYLSPTAHVSDLNIVSASVVSSSQNEQGILAGVNEGTVINCQTSGLVEGSSRRTGGMIGLNYGHVEDCSSMADIQGEFYVGGLIGDNSNEGQVTQCYSAGTVHGMRNYVGGLVGLNNAQVDKSYSTGTVTGERAVGGLLGANGSGYVANCYSTGAVTGRSSVGGLVGGNFGTVSQCYSLGAVVGEEHVGGLVGSNDWIVTHSFWDIETSGQSSSEGGIGLTTARMQDIDTYLNAGWDFFGRDVDGNEDTWVMETYPVLYSSQLPGKGTVESPYLISEENKLIAFKNMLPSAHYRLTEDIDLYGSQWEGPLVHEYSGTFDGSGFTLRNLTIIGQAPLGLVGSLDRDGTIKNLTLENVFVEGDLNGIGGLVGKNDGLVANCECTGVVTGDEYVGGLVGRNYQGHVSNCSSTATVTGNNYVGGIVGSNSISGYISNCSSTATVTGDSRVGGVVGRSSGDVINGHSNATVSGDEFRIGGIVGWNVGDVTNCYSTGSVNGYMYIGGLVGDNRGSIAMSYSTGSVTGEDRVGGLAGYNLSENAVITASFWDVQTSGRTNMCGFQEEGATGCDDSFGLTTAELRC